MGPSQTRTLQVTNTRVRLCPARGCWLNLEVLGFLSLQALTSGRRSPPHGTSHVGLLHHSQDHQKALEAANEVRP